MTTAADELDPELEAQLQTEPLKGLTDAEVEERLIQWGHNGTLLFDSKSCQTSRSING